MYIYYFFSYLYIIVLNIDDYYCLYAINSL